MSNAFPSPLVTAIVSTYNSAEFIRGCIEDLERQTIAEQLEIIVIDSASPQDEGQIIRELQQQYGNIHYLRTEQRETVYAAWNRAIGMARGTYITNANTDDRHRRDAFELMVRVLEHNPHIDLVYADVFITRTPHETYEQYTPAGRYSWHEWDRLALLDIGCFIGPQPMWRRSIHDLYGGFDDSYVTSGDFEFWLRISQTSSFRHISQPLGLYLAHPDSIEHRNEEAKQQENRGLLELYRQAAQDGKLVGFLPFKQLEELCGRPADALVSSAIGQLLHQIDQLCSQERSVAAALLADYASRQAMLAGAAGCQADTVKAYIHAATAVLLISREWHSRYTQVYTRIPAAELPVRHKVRLEAEKQAILLAQRGDLAAATDLLVQKAILAVTDDPQPYLLLLDMLLADNNYNAALEVVGELPASTDLALIGEIKAVCYAGLGDNAAAEQVAQAAVASGGERSRSLVVLGTLAARNTDLTAARQFFSQALKQNPASGSAWLAAGMLLWAQGDQERAWKSLRKAVAVNPLHGETVQLFVTMSQRLGCQQQALACLLEVQVLYPDSRLLSTHSILLLAQCGYREKALQGCEMFLLRQGMADDIIKTGLELRQQLGVFDRLADGGKNSISLCMIVKDEEQHLARCLASVKPVVHEMIVVDTGSTDKTVAIATVFGAKVHHFPWNGNFSDARNRSLESAQGAWILVLDADEVIAARDHDLIRGLVQDAVGTQTAWRVLTRNYTIRHPGGWSANDGNYPAEEQGGGWFPSSKVRLFARNSAVQFSGVVHEMVEDDAENAGYQFRDAPFVVHHYGRLHDDGGADLEKKAKYFELGLQKLHEHPDDLTALRELAVQASELKCYDEALELWDRFLALQPDTVIALFNKGYALMMLQRYREALELSRRVLDLDPGHKEAAFNYGTCELYVGDLQRAIPRLKAVLQYYPGHPPLLALLLVLELAVGNYEQAKYRYEQLRVKNYLVSDYLRDRLVTLEAVGRAELADSIRTAAGMIGLQV